MQACPVSSSIPQQVSEAPAIPWPGLPFAALPAHGAMPMGVSDSLPGQIVAKAQARNPRQSMELSADQPPRGSGNGPCSPDRHGPSYFFFGRYRSVIVPSNTSAAMPTDSLSVGCGWMV